MTAEDNKITDLSDFDWQDFRIKTAKEILCYMFNCTYGLMTRKELVSIAIELTDELIDQLKQK